VANAIIGSYDDPITQPSTTVEEDKVVLSTL